MVPSVSTRLSFIVSIIGARGIRARRSGFERVRVLEDLLLVAFPVRFVRDDRNAFGHVGAHARRHGRRDDAC